MPTARPPPINTKHAHQTHHTRQASTPAYTNTHYVSMTSQKEDFIASLRGRYNELMDSHTISIASFRRFNTYPYIRKLVIRKTIANDPGMSMFVSSII